MDVRAVRRSGLDAGTQPALPTDRAVACWVGVGGRRAAGGG